MCGVGKYTYRNYRCGAHWHKPDKPDCPNENRILSARLVEEKAWNWLDGLLKDENDLEEALNELEARKATEAEPNLKRLEAINGLIDKLERNIKRLARDSRESEDDFVAETLKSEMNLAGQQREGLIDERTRLETVLSRQVFTADTKEKILASAAAIRNRLINPTYQQKRDLFDLFDFRAIFRVDEGGRWLDVSCGLKPEGDVIMLDPSLAFFPR
jgi:hypothetical protein